MSEVALRPMPADFYPEISADYSVEGVCGRLCKHEYDGRQIGIGYAVVLFLPDVQRRIAEGDESLRQSVWHCCELVRLGRAVEGGDFIT